MTTTPTAANWASIGALGVIWGGTFGVVRMALDGYGPLTVACARTTLGALAMLALMALLRRPRPEPAAGLKRYLVAIGLLTTALPFFLLSWGQQYVPSAFAGISMAALPLFVLPLAHVFSDEPMTMRRTLGVLVGFGGALVLIGPGLTDFGSSTAPLAQLACLGAAVSYAAGAILTRRCPPVDPVALAALTLAIGAVALVPVMLLTEGLPRPTGTRSDLALIFLGLFPTALAALLRVSVIRSAGSVFLTLTNYLVPLFAMLFGTVLLGEELPLRFFLALALILAGLSVSQWRSLQRLLLRRAA